MEKPMFRSYGFTLVELQVSLLLLTLGVMSLAVVLRTHSRQMETLETRLPEDCLLIGQSDSWMRTLKAQATVTEDASAMAWTPTVTGEAEYTLTVSDLDKDVAAQEVHLSVTLTAVEESE